ncbi:MAG TPA: NADH-quinone oxidoreductase subunit N, partial [Polyangiaceae bacterium]
AEAAMKFFVVGVVSTPIALLGAAFLVALSASTDIVAIAQMPLEPIHVLGLVLLLSGMGFKLGVVPFHMWVPDTYQAAPTTFVAFLSTAPKLAAMAALSRIYVFGYASASEKWVPLVLLLSIATLILGNLSALTQSNTKRLLGYSGIGHVGYLLMGLLVVDSFGLEALLFYLVAYALTNLGAFLAVEAIESNDGDGNMTDLNGLWSRAPWLALSMLLFLLSLAGIPFVVGFWAKLYIFVAAWRGGHPGLVLLGALVAVVSLFYYLQLARCMYMTAPATNSNPLRVGLSLKVAVLVCVAGVVGLGLYPRPLLETAHAAAVEFGAAR